MNQIPQINNKLIIKNSNQSKEMKKYNNSAKMKMIILIFSMNNLYQQEDKYNKLQNKKISNNKYNKLRNLVMIAIVIIKKLIFQEKIKRI